MKILLELFRILFLFLILGALLGGAMNLVYAALGMKVEGTNGGWLVSSAILIFLFILYKNKFQFTGFYRGEGNVKLSRGLTVLLVSGSVILVVLAPFFQ
ncbi:hypothetical protein [Bacillus sp. P14.5]|uniref:hypothetical protein n=1 Tax=Bacillus sp. P14.5 TaxID=1983400 RepID=UPI001F05781C|nr:hypothetical protein [Bacillus sp. P14.5]